MFNTIEKLITIRNLKPKKKEGFLKVISIFSFLGIMLGVAILIIVMSVMNGFRSELTQKILGFNSHITIKPYDKKITEQFYFNLKNKYTEAKIFKTYIRFCLAKFNSSSSCFNFSFITHSNHNYDN